MSCNLAFTKMHTPKQPGKLTKSLLELKCEKNKMMTMPCTCNVRNAYTDFQSDFESAIL